MRRLSSLLLASSVTVLSAGASAQSATPIPPDPPSQAPAAAAPAPPAPPALQSYAPAPPYGYYTYAPTPGAWPRPAEPPKVGTERRSTALMITGFTVAGVGLTTLAVGAFFYTIESSIVYAGDCVQAPCGGPDYSKHTGGSIAAMVIGGTLFAAGLPLGIYGATKRPRALAPEVAVGPTSARLRWSF